MSMERRSQIYVNSDLVKRLRSAIDIYGITPKGSARIMTVEELAESILNKHITTDYPVVLELEQEYAAIEKAKIAKINSERPV